MPSYIYVYTYIMLMYTIHTYTRVVVNPYVYVRIMLTPYTHTIGHPRIHYWDIHLTGTSDRMAKEIGYHHLFLFVAGHVHEYLYTIKRAAYTVN